MTPEERENAKREAEMLNRAGSSIKLAKTLEPLQATLPPEKLRELRNHGLKRYFHAIWSPKIGRPESRHPMNQIFDARGAIATAKEILYKNTRGSQPPAELLRTIRQNIVTALPADLVFENYGLQLAREDFTLKGPEILDAYIGVLTNTGTNLKAMEEAIFAATYARMSLNGEKSKDRLETARKNLRFLESFTTNWTFPGKPGAKQDGDEFGNDTSYLRRRLHTLQEAQPALDDIVSTVVDFNKRSGGILILQGGTLYDHLDSVFSEDKAEEEGALKVIKGESLGKKLEGSGGFRTITDLQLLANIIYQGYEAAERGFARFQNAAWGAVLDNVDDRLYGTGGHETAEFLREAGFISVGSNNANLPPLPSWQGHRRIGKRGVLSETYWQPKNEVEITRRRSYVHKDTDLEKIAEYKRLEESRKAVEEDTGKEVTPEMAKRVLAAIDEDQEALKKGFTMDFSEEGLEGKLLTGGTSIDLKKQEPKPKREVLIRRIEYSYDPNGKATPYIHMQIGIVRDEPDDDPREAKEVDSLAKGIYELHDKIALNGKVELVIRYRNSKEVRKSEIELKPNLDYTTSIKEIESAGPAEEEGTYHATIKRTVPTEDDYRIGPETVHDEGLGDVMPSLRLDSDLKELQPIDTEFRYQTGDQFTKDISVLYNYLLDPNSSY